MEKYASGRGMRVCAACIFVGCLYGVMNFLSGKYYLPGCSFAELRPQVALPMFIGVLYGPLSGFVCGALGDMLGYTIAGKGPFFAVHWSFANGLMGFIPGSARYVGARLVESIFSFVKLLFLLVFASSLPFLFSTGVEFWLARISFHEALFSFFLPIFITDTLWAFILVPILMQAFGLLISCVEMRTIKAVYYMLIVTVLTTWLSSIIITMREEIQVEELYSLGVVTLIVLITGISVSAFLSKKITAPVIGLTHVAKRVAQGDYSRDSELQDIKNRRDEFGVLAGVFADMLRAVEKREKDLRNEVTTLRIKIDRDKQSADLEKITGSDYFKMLKEKAGNLRRKAVAGE